MAPRPNNLSHAMTWPAQGRRRPARDEQKRQRPDALRHGDIAHWDANGFGSLHGIAGVMSDFLINQPPNNRRSDELAPSSMFRAVSTRSEGHTSELQSLMRISYAVCGLKKKKKRR